MKKIFKRIVSRLLARADIKINGNRPCDIQVHNPDFYARVLSQGSLGLGESYLDGWWDVPALDQFFERIFRAGLANAVRWDPGAILGYLSARMVNQQAPERAFVIGQHHYDLGNDLYKAMLDPYMAYSCAYWARSVTLASAQEAKLNLICRKLQLQPGEHILDIGGGWGSLARYAAEHYGVSVDIVTVSKEQISLGQELCQDLPIKFFLQDYRKITQQYDKIVSVGMIEHVGYQNYRTYMEVVAKALRPGGLFLLHTIGGLKSVKSGDPWMEKYIFPHSMLPSETQLRQAFDGLFQVRDWHGFGHDYDPTLMAWFKNFDQAWPDLQAKYGSRFYRIWKYYLLSCAGSFRAGKNQVWQIIFSHVGEDMPYSIAR